MKKLLAMVLALVMTLSLAVSANAFTDDSKVNDSYAEAVAVLNGMGVFKGYEDGSFKPEGDITRAEVATIVYRIYTADVAKNDKSSLYASYNKFSDMAGASWAAGYIGYCANAELVKGYPDGTFKPSGKVTGYEVLAMILRAVGYDKNGEFSGADWALHVAQTAQQADMLKNVKGVDLNAAATRELVAELLFRGIQTPTVTYTPAFGYVTDKVIGTATSTIGVKNFKLDSKDDSDEWGRPATTWTYSTGDKETTVVDKPNNTYTTAVTECDVAHDAGLKADKTYSLVVNGQAAQNYVITRLDTVTKIGAQGRLTEVYDDVIVMIDTFLAKVISVSDATYDAQGHLKNEATIKLAVVLGDTPTVPTTENYVLKNGETNYTYAKGDYVLVNAKTTNATYNGSATLLDTAAATQYGEIVDKASSFDGAQTVIHYNDGKHTVEGTDYNDALEFHLNQATNEVVKHTWLLDQYNNLIGVVDIETAYTYGVIKAMWWVGDTSNGAGDAIASVVYMDGSEANVTLGSLAIDGNKANTPRHSTNTNLDMTVTATSDLTGILYVDTNAYTNETSTGNTDSATGTGIIGGHLFRFNTLANGKVAAVEMTKELTTAVITKSVSAISGTASADAASPVYTNSSTKYLVQVLDTVNDTVSYKVVEGYTNIDSYTEATVDYVDLNNDGWVDYVYVTGEPTSAVTSNLFYLTTTGYTYTTNAAGEIDDYILTGYVDGQPGTIKVSASTHGALAVGAGSIIAGGANKAWVVTQTNGYVTAIQNFGGAYGCVTPVTPMSTMNPANSLYTDMSIVAITGAAGDKVEGEVYYDADGSHYGIKDVTPVLGAWAADMSNKNLVLVFKGDTLEVTYAYIVDKADQPIEDVTVTAASLKLDSVANQVTGTFNPGSVTDAGKGVVITYYFREWNSGAPFTKLSVVASNDYAASTDAPLAAVTVPALQSGKTYEVYAVAVNAAGATVTSNTVTAIA